MGILESNVSDKFWPPLVKNVEITSDYPGYKMRYFTSFDELNDYFSKECGEEWMQQEWAKYWIGQHQQTRYEDRVEKQILTGQIDASKFKTRYNYEELRDLISSFLEKKPRASLRAIANYLKARGQTAKFQTVQRVIKYYNLRGK